MGAVGTIPISALLPTITHLRAFGLARSDLARYARTVWVIGAVVGAVPAAIVVILERVRGGVLSDNRLLALLLVTYLGFLVQSRWATLMETRTIDNENILPLQRRLGNTPTVSQENAAEVEAKTGLKDHPITLLVKEPIRHDYRVAARWAGGAFLACGLLLALAPTWTTSVAENALPIAPVILVPMLAVSVGESVRESFVHWIAFSGDRCSWRTAIRREILRGMWAIPLCVMALVLPSLMNSEAYIPTHFATVEVLIGGLLLGLACTFLCSLCAMGGRSFNFDCPITFGATSRY